MALRGKSARAQVPLRIPEVQRARIEKAAKARGASMNAEIVERLERSFELEDRLGGPRVAGILEVVGAAMQSTGHSAAMFAGVDRDSWLGHPFCFDQAAKAAVAVLEHHRPPGEIVVPAPNVVETVGGDPLESAKRLRQVIAELGVLMAAKEIKKKEQDK
jgi:hypothetical protein